MVTPGLPPKQKALAREAAALTHELAAAARARDRHRISLVTVRAQGLEVRVNAWARFRRDLGL